MLGKLTGGMFAFGADADEDGKVGGFVEYGVREALSLVGRELEHLAGEAEADDAVRPALNGKSNELPLSADVDVTLARERRRDAWEDAVPVTCH
jgi:hypothetical protein